MRRKLSLTVKTDDVTKGRKDLDPHGRLRANGLSTVASMKVERCVVLKQIFHH